MRLEEEPHVIRKQRGAEPQAPYVCNITFTHEDLPELLGEDELYTVQTDSGKPSLSPEEYDDVRISLIPQIRRAIVDERMRLWKEEII